MGKIDPQLQELKALAGVKRRDYSYDVFWVVFPLVSENGMPIISDEVREVDLIVRIYNKEGKLSWVVPDSIRARVIQAAK